MLRQTGTARLEGGGGPAPGKGQHGGGLAGGGPRRHPPPPAQHPDQLRLPQPGVPGRGRGGEGVGQPGLGGQGVQGPAGGEPGTGRAAADVVQEPGRDRLARPGPRPGQVLRPHPGRQPGQPRLEVIRVGLRVTAVTGLPARVDPLISEAVSEVAGPVVFRLAVAGPRRGGGTGAGSSGAGAGRRGCRAGRARGLESEVQLALAGDPELVHLLHRLPAYRLAFAHSIERHRHSCGATGHALRMMGLQA